MAEILPLQALHYDLATVGRLQDVVAPPYDVIDAQRRAELAARSPYNVVHVDLPEAEAGGDPYAHAAALLADWRAQGALVRDAEPAIWALTQDYRAPDGRDLTRRGFLCRVRVEDYGAGRIRPHERTHPGPKEDRLRLTRATKSNLSPIFSLFSDPTGATWDAFGPHVERDEPFDAVTDEDGTVNRLWRVADPAALAAVTTAVAGSELLIADGHHRYETARAYAEEIGGEGDHRYVLMCLVALEDPGLTVLPTHRLVTGLKDDSARQEALAAAIRRDFELVELDDERALVPEPARDGRVHIGFIDAHFKRPFMLTLKDPSVADAALPDRAAPYRRLDTAVLEAILLKGPLGMTDATIDHLDGLGYARDFDEALARIHDESADVGFFMGATPIAHVQEV